jgi:hypothetical protein
MKEKFLPYFLLFCALGLSITAAYYSVMGLSILFASVAIPVIVMGSFLEVSKIAIATYLHDQWKKTLVGLKIYLTVALITLSFITSLGIYGLLTTGFQENISKMEIGDKQIENLQIKKDRFEEIKQEFTLEKQTLDADISNLRNALSTNTTTQSVDKQTGQLITRANNANRQSFENQLNSALENKNRISSKIESLNDSITSLDIQILNMVSQNELGNELGAIKYVSEITGKPIKNIANIFILLIIFVFDPLAIILVITTNHAFKNLRKKEDKPEIKIEEKPQPQLLVETPTIKDNQEEIRKLEEEKNKLINSGIQYLAKDNIIHNIQEKINKLKNNNENIIEY